MTPVLLLALLALQERPQVLPRPPAVPEPPSAYEQLVTRYQQGDYDGAVAEVARHPGKLFEQPFDLAFAKLAYHAQDEKLRQVQRRGLGISIVPRDWFKAQDEVNRFLLAVMMLHTEAALRASVDEMHAQLRVARTAEKALIDAERELEPHVWNKVKFAMPQDPQADVLTKADVERARHDWVVLVTLGYHARSVLAGLRAFIESALQRYPGDPALTLCLAVYYERTALFGIVDVSLMKTLYSSDQVARWRRQLELALQSLDQTARDPELAIEARLRTGRIRALLGDTARARSELEPLTSPGSPLMIRYFALMELARADESEQRPDAAAAKYRDALGLYPTAQAPFVALSRLDDLRGDTAGAKDWLEKSFGLNNGRRIDPWWWYYSPFIDRPALVNSLRTLVHR